MRKKVEERKRARELRAQGWSLRQIARDLEVALSSVSVWVREIEFDADGGQGDGDLLARAWAGKPSPSDRYRL
jgi:transposase